MFRHFVILLTLITSSNAVGGTITADRDEIEFSGEIYYLAKSVGDANGIWNQCLPQNQTIDNWSRSLSLRLYYKQESAEDLMENQKELVQETFPEAQMASQITRDGKEARLRYIVQAEKPIPIAEFSMWRFVEMKEPRVQILAYQFSHRQFTEDLVAFETSLDQRLPEWTDRFLRVRYKPPQFRVKTREIDSLQTQGIYLIEEGETARGLSLMIQAVEQDPQNPIRHLNVGRVLFPYAKGLLQPETMEEAMLLFNRAQEFFEEAEHLFEVFDPESEAHSKTLFYLGEIEFHIKENYERAEVYYRRALKMDPLNRDARQALEPYPQPTFR